MPRKRLLVETSESLKSALLSAVDSQDLTLTDWLQEQIEISIPNVRSRVREERAALLDRNELAHPQRLFKRLQEQDWAFTDDDTQYLTHDLHPYPAKFIPQIPANLITRLSIKGDIVFDPFGGSATTAVEAVRLGRRAISMDANPLSAIMGRVKTGFMTPDVKTDLEQLIAAVAGHILNGSLAGETWGARLVSQFAEKIPPIQT